jgi:transcription-repair coupling factor (superfamily II helicase)
MKELVEALAGGPAYRALQRALEEPAARAEATNLTGSSKGLLVAALAERARQPKAPWTTVLAVTPTTEAADSLVEDLRAFLGENAASVFPSWEVLPYENRDPHPEIVGERLEFLAQLARGEVRVGVVPARALQELVVGPQDLGGMVLKLRVGDRWNRERLLEALVRLGFEREVMVSEVGEFSARGGIVDLYGFGMASPVRLEFDGDEIALLRSFDVGTQRSVEPLQEATILPAREPGSPRSPSAEGPGASGLRARARLVSLAAYLPAQALVVLDEPEQIEVAWQRHWEEVLERHRAIVREREEEADLDRLTADAPGGSLSDALDSTSDAASELADPEARYAAPEVLQTALQNRRQLTLHALHMEGSERTVRFATRDPEPIGRNIARLREVLDQNRQFGIASTIFCDNLGQLERLDELLGQDGSLARLAVGTVAAGFRLLDEKVAVYTDHEIFERQRRIPRRRRYRVGAPLESFSDIHPGDYLVHIDYGIGRFLGIERLDLSGGTIECLAVQYAEGDKLYVPVDRLGLVEKYTSEDGAQPRLHRLGGPGWEKQKARTRRAIEDMTEELLELYARREVDRGFAFSKDLPWQHSLEASFLYEDTPDQASATEAVKLDMESRRPMDRLLCGDVGYGKTEVAIRAAFKAVQDGKQVAVLVPTTILAAQHLSTFRERLADFPVRVEALSRFRSPKEQRAVLEALAKGDVDIVIGTHRLLSKDVAYRDLGLVIVDEEQRFGVKHKERLRQIRTVVDVLTMTATPIPRTLYFSLSGIRDMSLIQTPPRDRIPVVTTVAHFDEELIREALRRELDRGGQVFFIHNRVETIDEVARLVRRLVPEARMEVAHGQMPEAELEQVMLRFYEGRVDVLVSTTIVESGLDVPRANTLIVNRADRFGLSELYQLRGRVGRSHRRAYAYLLTPPRAHMTEEAEKRLRVLEEYGELGAGYQIALKDLEIRGAGNLLGREQSGFVQSVGLETYLKLLEEAVRRLRGQEAVARAETEVSFEGPAYLPDSYIPDSRQKLNLYRRASRLDTPAEVGDFTAELVDRYGPLPVEAVNLLSSLELKLLGSAAGVRRIRMAPRAGSVELEWPERVVPPFGLLESPSLPESCRLDVLSQRPFRLRVAAGSPGAALEAARAILAAAAAARPAAQPAGPPVGNENASSAARRTGEGDGAAVEPAGRAAVPARATG